MRSDFHMRLEHAYARGRGVTARVHSSAGTEIIDLADMPVYEGYISGKCRAILGHQDADSFAFQFHAVSNCCASARVFCCITRSGWLATTRSAYCPYLSATCAGIPGSSARGRVVDGVFQGVVHTPQETYHVEHARKFFRRSEDGSDQFNAVVYKYDQ
jgi:hypothetical protein